jgi:beta-lactamase superfamily II metal-dependent hydrolase
MRQATCAIVLAFAGLWSATGDVIAADAPELKIYFTDMVGGAATLIVTPQGQSVLIDTGSHAGDARRIFAAAQHAGLRQIDFLVTTHFHNDHFGGILDLTKLLPVKQFYEKGPPLPNERKWIEGLYARYQEATGGKALLLKAGDDIPLTNDPQGRTAPVRLHCVAADAKVEGFDGEIDAPVPGFTIRGPDRSDNARSIALVLEHGKFRFFAGGDITWNVEHHLAHPKNRVGQVDLFQVTHHGLDASNNPILLKALNPTVCIALNGPQKGIEPNTFRALRAIPGVKAIYQMHYNTRYGDEGNTDMELIANGKTPAKGEFIFVSVRAGEGKYTVSLGAEGPRRTFHVK